MCGFCMIHPHIFVKLLYYCKFILRQLWINTCEVTNVTLNKVYPSIQSVCPQKPPKSSIFNPTVLLFCINWLLSLSLCCMFSTWSVHDLTGRVFFVAHLKLDASVKFPGDQSVGHNHHQPRDCKQHKQQQNVPRGNTWKGLERPITQAFMEP